MVKRDVIDVLRRGIDNTLANWPVILLRLGEQVVLAILSIAVLIAAIVPLAVAIGIHAPALNDPDTMLEAIEALIRGWPILLWILAVVFVLFGVIVAVHAFFVAGCARIAVDADRAAPNFRVFTMERWLGGATSGWWPIFWIYNLAWGFSALLILIPLIPTALLILLLRDSDAAPIAVGCAGLLLTLFFFLAVAIATALWTNRAIVEWASRRLSARASLRTAWRALRLDLVRHVLVALAIVIVAMAGSSFFASIGAFSSIGHSLSSTAIVQFITMPMRLFMWLLSSVFSAATATWFLTAYAALAEEEASHRASESPRVS